MKLKFAILLFDICDWLAGYDLVPFFIFSRINSYVSKIFLEYEDN